MILKWAREVLSLIMAEYLKDAPPNAELGHLTLPEIKSLKWFEEGPLPYFG